MDILKKYIGKQKGIFFNNPDRPEAKSSIFVVIPCYDEPDILSTLNSLARCITPQCATSVIVVINDAEGSPEEAVLRNSKTLCAIADWKSQHPQLFFEVQRIYAPSLSPKWAGVGWARKIGMDEAVKQIVGNNLSDGLLISLDADCLVMPDYLQTIETAFRENPKSSFFTLHFEHPCKNNELSREVHEGIINYELHMRYYRNALEWSGYPHAIHTVGSSFAVRASSYAMQGGMNRRKAGEDFYFLHKMVLLGNYGNISSTKVLPASRISERVPFGTGAALKKWVEGGNELNYTYSLEAFGYLKPLFSAIQQLWTVDSGKIRETMKDLHPTLLCFCDNSGMMDEILLLKENCSDGKIFEKRFFHLFNAFRILKYLNFVHEASLEKGNLLTEAKLLLMISGIQTEDDISAENLLEIYRELDKKQK